MQKNIFLITLVLICIAFPEKEMCVTNDAGNHFIDFTYVKKDHYRIPRADNLLYRVKFQGTNVVYVEDISNGIKAKSKKDCTSLFREILEKYDLIDESTLYQLSETAKAPLREKELKKIQEESFKISNAIISYGNEGYKNVKWGEPLEDTLTKLIGNSHRNHAVPGWSFDTMIQKYFFSKWEIPVSKSMSDEYPNTAKYIYKVIGIYYELDKCLVCGDEFGFSLDGIGELFCYIKPIEDKDVDTILEGVRQKYGKEGLSKVVNFNIGGPEKMFVFEWQKSKYTKIAFLKGGRNYLIYYSDIIMSKIKEKIQIILKNVENDVKTKIE